MTIYDSKSTPVCELNPIRLLFYEAVKENQFTIVENLLKETDFLQELSKCFEVERVENQGYWVALVPGWEGVNRDVRNLFMNRLNSFHKKVLGRCNTLLEENPNPQPYDREKAQKEHTQNAKSCWVLACIDSDEYKKEIAQSKSNTPLVENSEVESYNLEKVGEEHTQIVERFWTLVFAARYLYGIDVKFPRMNVDESRKQMLEIQRILVSMSRQLTVTKKYLRIAN